MNAQEKWLNYFLLLGFILIIIIFLSSLVFISRSVFSDITPIGKHVINTKELLDDIKKVEKITSGINENKSNKIYDLAFKKEEKLNAAARDIGLINVNDKKTIFTMIIDNKVINLNGTYYEVIKNISLLSKGDHIIYADNNEGSFISFDNIEILLYDFDVEKIINISEANLLGRVFLVN